MSLFSAIFLILFIGGLLYVLITMPSRINWEPKEPTKMNEAWLRLPWYVRAGIEWILIGLMIIYLIPLVVNDGTTPSPLLQWWIDFISG